MVKVPKLPDIDDMGKLTDEILKKVISEVRDIFGPSFVVVPYFEGLKAADGRPLDEAIHQKIEQDVDPELWGNLAFDILVERHTQAPELVENLIFGYLVRIQYDTGSPLVSRISGKPLSWDTWGTYFRTVKDPHAVVEYLFTQVLAENEDLTPDNINNLEVLPGIPYTLTTDYMEGKITIEDVRRAIESLPAL